MFEVCSTCDFFQPDPKWREPLEEYIAIYDKRVQELETIGGNPNTIEFLIHQRTIYEQLLEKIENQKTNFTGGYLYEQQRQLFPDRTKLREVSGQ